jgi:hypothetical protein
VNSVTAERVREAPLTFVRAIPAWAWLAGIVAVSTAVHYGLGRRMIAPWIMVDELIYSELAKTFADSGTLAIRGDGVGGAYGVVYPLLISPAFALFDSVPDAYAAAKAINGLLMSLAAVPTYFLARRVLSQLFALAAAALSVALPSLLYAGTLMTENAFYPIFLCAALALVLALERPTPLRAAILLAVCGFGFATRAQAAVLVFSILLGPVLVVLIQRRGWRGLVGYAWLYLPLVALPFAVLLQAVRGHSPLDLLGAYRAAGEERYDLGEAAKWLLYHVAELDLSLGVAPFLALVLLVLSVRRLERRDQVFVSAAIALTAPLVLLVSVFASRHALRVEERNMFYVAPLFLIALLLWVERGLPRPRIPTLLAAGTAAILPALLPYSRLIGVSAVSDTFGLMPWWTVHEWGIPLDRLWIPVLLGASAVAAVSAWIPVRFAVALPALVLVFFVVSQQPVEERIRNASVGALFQGITRPERDWVDRAVREDGSVAAVYSGALDHLTVLENEFFSRAVGPVYTLSGPMPGGLAQTALRQEARTGHLLDPDRQPVRARYALVDTSVPLAGRIVARDEPKGMRVLRVGGALRVTHSVAGIYGDGWSGSRATYTRYNCRGGMLVAVVESDPNLFSGPQSVIARVNGKVLDAGRIPRVGRGRLVVPLKPREGRCVVFFAISPTAVPGDGDSRELGTHFRSFRYWP